MMQQDDEHRNGISGKVEFWASRRSITVALKFVAVLGAVSGVGGIGYGLAVDSVSRTDGNTVARLESCERTEKLYKDCTRSENRCLAIIESQARYPAPVAVEPDAGNPGDWLFLPRLIDPQQ